MAGRGPPPKAAATRQRRNRPSVSATLPTEAASFSNDVPELPARQDEQPWHPMVIDWWSSIWRSPMASEFLDADKKGGLYLLADLHQMRWHATGRALIEASKEIRLQEVRFGLSPVDRRRLQWEVERGESAAARTSSRKPRKMPAGDPRANLKLA